MPVSQYRIYKIVSGKDGGAGSAFSPPNHHSHTYSLHEMSSNRWNAYVTGIMGLDYLDDPAANASPAIMAEWARIKEAANASISELWLRSVYAHFRNCYRPESGSANASDVIIWKADRTVANHVRAILDARDITRGGRSLMGPVAGYQVRLAPDYGTAYLYWLTGEYAEDGNNPATLDDAPVFELLADVMRDAGYEPEIQTTRVKIPGMPLPPRLPAERHSAVCYVRGYFPDHEPREDLITGVVSPNGPCEKCGNNVQYEGRNDSLCIVSTDLVGTRYSWTYNPVCSDGGPHVR